MSVEARQLGYAAVLLLLVPVGEARAQVAAGPAYYNPYTGVGSRNVAGYNPYTGTRSVGTNAYNPYTGTRATNRDYYNPVTGSSAEVQKAYNPYTGKYAYHYSYQRR